MENQAYIKQLLADYLNKQISREEFNQLFSQLGDLEDEAFKATVLQVLESQPAFVDARFIDERVAALYPQLQAKIERPVKWQRRWHLVRPYISVAAVVLVILFTGWFLLSERQYPKKKDIVTTEQVLPGTNRAKLTLADGLTVDLSEYQNGVIMGDEIKYSDGSRVLGSTGKGASLMTISTPKGGTYQITLSDGTQVWLNAGSSLSYPAHFPEGERMVEVSGEAYFEVAKDEKRPFKVSSSGQQIEVLGTAFNIAAYPDEADTKTTLVQGKVKVFNLIAHHSNLLRPGQQATVHGAHIEVGQANVEASIAWKDGLFNFHELTIDQAMKQIERWYDVNVRYEGKKPSGYLGGKMSRGVKLSTFLNFLEQDFQIKAEWKSDRTLILKPAS
ncbi:hypothetical protein GCM10023231_36000 [Olivibacter ginsenosidimutans]|uniref:DUF4974 domain-containing protein n=1 Tax=Olivibacter ginsenosidimutans TaxID=1176537 RepID=A0ABP9C2N8_9SPHI